MQFRSFFAQFRSFFGKGIVFIKEKLYKVISTEEIRHMELMNSLDRINDKIVGGLLSVLETEKTSDETQAAKVKYVLTCLVNMAEKAAGLLLLFGAAHRLKEFIICSISLTSLRVFMGGMHRKTALGCFLHTSLVFGMLLLAGDLLPIRYLAVWVVFPFTAVLIWKTTPLPSENRIRYSERQRKYFQLRAFVVLAVLFATVGMMSKKDGSYVIWAVIFQSAEVLAVTLKKWRKEVPYGKEEP